MENHNLELTARRGIIVWIYSLKQLKTLRKFGYIHYVSKKMKYVILYVNESEVSETIEKLNKQFFVRSVEMSYRPDINMNFSNRLGNQEEETKEPLDFEEQKIEIKLAEFEE